MRRALLLIVALAVAGSCAVESSESVADPTTSTAGASPSTVEPDTPTTGPEWAMPGLRFLDALNASIRDGDTEAVLSFYHPSARLEQADDGSVATGLRQISDAVDRLPEAEHDLVLIGYEFAATVSGGECADPDCPDPWVDLYQIWDGAIGLQIRAGLADPESAAEVHTLFVDSAVAYSDHDIDAMSRFYSDAVFAPGFPVEEYETLFETFPDLAAEPMTLADLGVGTTETPALFDLGSIGGSSRERVALGIYRVTFTPTVHTVAATVWRLWDGEIVEAATLFDPMGWNRMLESAGIEPAPSWYSTVEIPEARSVERTHVIDAEDGTTIDLYNASDRAAELVEWSLDRFRIAGLEPPHVGAIYLETERSCLEESAWTYLSETTADIRLCLSEDEIAGDDGLTVAARITMLHELAHVWTAEHLSETERTDFVAGRGLVTWNDGSVPWSERGNEQAAEIIAWGLSETTFDLVRIGDPSCDQLVRTFRSLTGVAPTHGC